MYLLRSFLYEKMLSLISAYLYTQYDFLYRVTIPDLDILLMDPFTGALICLASTMIIYFVALSKI